MVESIPNPKKGAWQLPLTLASVLLGLLITVQFKTQEREGFPMYHQGDQMSRMVKYLETDRNKLLADLQETRQREARVEGTQGERKDMEVLKGLKAELLRARMLAGLVPVKGPGIAVTLMDSPRRPGPNDDAYFFLIHDADILAVANELWAAGAEAVAVNDQRLVTSSSVRCVGPTVLVNSTRLAPPYVIRAIGDPKTLETALRMPGGVIDNMEASVKHGVTVTVQRPAEPLVLPEFKGAESYRYLQAAHEDP